MNRDRSIPGGRPLPAAIPFVGRGRELEALDDAVERAFQGRGSICLLAGEPGIGKSRLADEVAGRARERGGVVLWGRCWEAGGAPAYWPWVQSLRSLVRTIGAETAIGHLGDDADELAQLLPEIRELRPVALESPTADPDAARFRLFDSLTRFLLGAASDRPLVVVLDDLHAADVPSLLLLRFQAAQMRDAALMLVGTYRDVAVDPGHPMAATVAELLREPHTRLFPLKGLSVPEVSALIEATTGTPPDEAVTATVHDETQGNPLFVAEVVRLLAAEGRLMDPSVGSTRVAVPEGVREVIGQRLERLSDACRNLLALASVLGREFTIEALGRVSELPSTELLALLEEAAEARLISDVPGTLGGLRFSHALVRDSLYEGISPPRRYDLHQGAAVALERLYGAEDESHLAEIAHHWFVAAPAGHARQAVEATRRAGDRAMELLAYEEAARLFEKAMRALALAGAPDVRERVELLLALGDARGRAGDEPGEKRTMLEAVRLARDRGLPEHLARAALGYGGRLVWRRAAGDDRLVELVEEALSALPPGDSALRARLLARLSGALRDEPAADRRGALSGEAVRMARRLGDQEALAYALLARYTAIWSPDSTREQLEIAEELKRIAAEIGDRDRLLQAVLIRHKALMTLGELEEARAEHVASARLAEETRQPSQAWYVAADRATLALLEGRFDQAEDLVRDARRVGGSAQRMEAETAYRLQLFWLRRERGRAAEAERHIRDAVHEFPWYPMFRCALANLYAAMGRRDEARVVFEDLAVRKFDDLPFDNEWLFGMCLLPEVAALLEDRSAARRLYERLCPYADLAANSPPELWLGPVDRYLGILAGVEGLLDEAAEHLSAAVDRSLRMGATPFVAHAQHELAAALLRRDAPGDGGRARELASGALERARDLGMDPLFRSVSALLAGTRPSASTPVSGVFRRGGDYWTIAYGGEAIRLRDSKGLRYLHRLLASPAKEVHVADLASPGRSEQPAEPSLEGTDAGHAGELLDPQATSAYRRRVEDLREEIDEAERWADPERAARARGELEFISSQLAEAYGLGGRARRGADRSERIRKAVTNRIRDALDRIGRDLPSLGKHLANSVMTGTFCSYAPDRPIRWDLEAPPPPRSGERAGPRGA